MSDYSRGTAAPPNPQPNVDRGVGEAASLIANLARHAAGEVVLDAAEMPDGPAYAGLPKLVPVLLRSGANPAIAPDLKGELEKWRVAPQRRSGTAKVTTLASFIDLVNRHKDEHSVLFAQTTWPGPHLQCVVDYHEENGAPRFGGHRIRYDFPVTKEFAEWIGRNGKPFDQAEFASFVEERIAELSVATEGEKEQYEALFKMRFAVPTDLVDLARGLEVSVGAKVKNNIRLQSGEMQIQFDVQHTGADGEPLHVPGLFLVCLPTFLDGGLVRIVARLRYRVKGGDILWFYDLYQWEEVLRRRVGTDFANAASQTGLLAIEGAPEV